MKAIVNKDTCIGCGLCASMCPEVYNLDDEEGKAEAIDEEIDESLIDEAINNIQHIVLTSNTKYQVIKTEEEDIF